MPTEKQVVAWVYSLYRSVGCCVYSTQQTRASRQALGLPDLYVVHPAGAWWHEVKRPGGKQSPVQVAFQHTVERAGVVYVLGGVDAARAQLARLGIILDGVVVDLRGSRP